MKSSPAYISVLLVSLFLVSLFASMPSGTPVELENEQKDVEQASSATSPGHVVFAQYISSDNCGHCSKQGGGSDTHHLLKGNFPDEYVYVTYMSQSYGDTDTARAGNVAPYNWAWSTGGAPDAYFGDRTDKRQSGASANYDTYDSLFSSGGGMHTTVNDYSMSAAVSQNGNNYDISIGYRYIGSSSPATNMKLYAALVDKDCTGYSYSSGIPHGYNCWMAWLTSGDTYKAKSSGSGTAFHSVTVSATEQFETWTSVPTSVVPGGINKAVVVGVLMSGNQVSVGGSSAHVYHAIDSTMGPKMDVAVTDFSISNPSAVGSYKPGDILTLEAELSNTGDLDYTDGGTVEFYYRNGVNEVAIDSSNSVPSLITGSSGTPATFSTTFDTSNLPLNSWTTQFGVRMKNLVGDIRATNNFATIEFDHDRAPLSMTPTVTGANVIERGEYITVLARGDANDNVDSIETTTFEVEISPSGLDQWDGSLTTGGETIVYQGTINEGREYSVRPTADMASGNYDVRARAVDSRGQTSDWSVASGSNGFELANGRPAIIPEPVPSVMCDIPTRLDMTGHIVDPETPLDELIVDSSHDAFLGWYPATTEIEVLFEWDEIQGCPIGQQGIEVTVDDGGDYSDTGLLPYGTLLFNVIENGQPRWQGLPTQLVDEGGSGILTILNYLSDTDDEGQPVSVDDLSLQIMDNSNPEVIKVELKNNILGFETVDDDINGESTVTIRASDGEQYADQTVRIQVTPMNDAPRIDMTDIENFDLKRGKQMVINLNNRLTDVDDPANEAFITVTPSEPGAARYNLLDGSLTLLFDSSGMQTVTISASDKYDTNTYTMNVNVFDAYPFYISTEDDGSGHLYISLEDTYISQTPTASIFLVDDETTFVLLEITWSLCNDISGTCDGFWTQELEMSKSNLGWTQEMMIPSAYDGGETYARPNGVRYMDYITASAMAVDTNGDEYKLLGNPIKWQFTEELPPVTEMDDVLLMKVLDDLNEKKASYEAQIAESDGDTTLLEDELAEIISQLSVACDDPRADCPADEVQGTTDADDTSSSLDMNMVYLVIGILVIATLLGVMMMRRGGDQPEVQVWDDATLPAYDQTANSMYGGAADIFQKPLVQIPQPAAPLPPAPPQVAAGPPLPPGGLPAGWTMEQWQYYGQQYLDSLNQF
jgi:hypothetical protein